jgi:hypothetical protein
MLPGVASAGAAAPDPPANLQLGALPLACDVAPVSPACEDPLIGDLDAARQALGLGPYELPSDFATLAPDRQLFILVNLDRTAYSLPLISGLSPQLDAAAQAGAVVEQDPAAPSADRAVWASAWAAGLVNVLDAYYQWMYSDGFASLNIDCSSPGAAGCWVHRHGILFAFAPSARLTMGAAIATDAAGRPAVGMLIAATPHATGPPEDYTWADAQADGAGGPAAAASSARRRVAPTRPRITGSRVNSSAATIYFTAGRRRLSFQCALVAGSTGRPARVRYTGCRSPAYYAELGPGVYDFRVRTVTPAHRHSTDDARRLRIT